MRWILCLVLAGCGGAVESELFTDASTTGDASDGGTTTTDASRDAPRDVAPGDYGACFDNNGRVRDSMKRCNRTDDCTFTEVQVDCCGSIVYVGIGTASEVQFEACNQAWSAHWPACGCAAQPSKTEDGKQITDPNQVAVVCNGGLCRTLGGR
jgi:hypothetical protein